jgi:hypothetical protein
VDSANNNLIFADVSTSRIGILNSTPTEALDVNGRVKYNLTQGYTIIGNALGKTSEVAVTNILSGKGTLIAGNCTIADTGITTNSWAVVCVSTTGVSTSVPIKFTANTGSMLFSTGQAGDTCEFGYIIFI